MPICRRLYRVAHRKLTRFISYFNALKHEMTTKK